MTNSFFSFCATNTHHGVAHVAVELDLLGRVGKVEERPKFNSDSLVVEELNVKVSDARIQLNAHVEICDRVS